MKAESKNSNYNSDLINQIEELKPWRYSHEHKGISIEGNTQSSQVFEEYGRETIRQILDVLKPSNGVGGQKALDLGCLEGHYTDLLAEAGYGQVIGVDLSERHIKRAQLLLQEIKKYQNVELKLGNVTDSVFMRKLGKFNTVFFHGLLYHLKDPLKMFDILNDLTPEEGPSRVLLSTQFKGAYSAVISPYPLAELQVKPLKRTLEGQAYVFSPEDESVFERCSFRLNPMALFKVLQLYDYKTIIAYDTPGGTSNSFHINLILSRKSEPELLNILQSKVTVPGVRFYEWQGKSVNQYHFRRNIRSIVGRKLLYWLNSLLN